MRDRLVAAIGPALMEVDPDHIVNDQMVDVRVVPVGPLDRVRSAAFATVFARREPARSGGAAAVVSRLRTAVDPEDRVDLVVELVLNDHTSSFDYEAIQ